MRDRLTNNISKIIVTSAGKGLRARPMTSIIPKCLLPIFAEENGKKSIKPLVNFILAKFSHSEPNRYCFVVGDKGGILMNYLMGTETTFVFQNEQKGFGDAVLRAEHFAGDSPFFVHADDGVLTGGYREAAELFSKYEADAVLLLRERTNPNKKYGMATVAPLEDNFMGHKAFKVTGVEEKPEHPKSNLMISAVYIFSPKIFNELKRTEVDGMTGELELTGGIQRLIESTGKVYGLLLEKERWLNVGDPYSYFEALKYSYEPSD